jgi:hypothetical protein
MPSEKAIIERKDLTLAVENGRNSTVACSGVSYPALVEVSPSEILLESCINDCKRIYLNIKNLGNSYCAYKLYKSQLVPELRVKTLTGVVAPLSSTAILFEFESA